MYYSPGYDKKEARRTFSRLFLSLFVYLVVSVAVIYLAQIIMMAVFGIEGAVSLLSNSYVVFGLQVLAMYVIAFPVFLLMTKDLDRTGEHSFDMKIDRDGHIIYTPGMENEKSRLSLGEFMLLFFVSSAVMTFGAVISNLFTEYLSGILGHTVENPTAELISESPLWLIILVAVIIGPTVEELIFRKVFIDIVGVYGTRLAIITSAIAFGIFHGNFSQVLYAALLGLILGYMYTKTHKIGYSILMHMLVNFFGTVPSLLASDSFDRIANMSEQLSESELMALIPDLFNVYGIVFMQYGFAIAGVVIFIYCTSKRLYKVPDECEVAIPTTSVMGTVCFNVGCAMFLLFSAFQFAASLAVGA